MPRSYLTFYLQGAWYAVEVSAVKEILRLPALTPITEAPSYIVGVVNYRGRILPVMDLSMRLGQAARLLQIHDHVIVLERANQLMGVIVNQVHEVQEIPTDSFEMALDYAETEDTTLRLVRQVAKYDDKTIMLLNDAPLFRLPPMHESSVVSLPSMLPVAFDKSAPDHSLTSDVPVPMRVQPQPLHLNATPEEVEILRDRARSVQHSLSLQEDIRRTAMAVVGLSGEYFGVELEAVHEFIELQRITPVPCCPEHVVGDMNLRGDILTVIDIRRSLQLAVSAVPATAKVIVLPMGDSVVGVVVDQVYDVLEVSPSQLTAIPIALKVVNDTYLKGAVSYQNKMLMILDLPKILSQDELIVSEEVQ